MSFSNHTLPITVSVDVIFQPPQEMYFNRFGSKLFHCSNQRPKLHLYTTELGFKKLLD